MADMAQAAVFNIVGNDLLSGPAGAAESTLGRLEQRAHGLGTAFAAVGVAMAAAAAGIAAGVGVGIKAAGDLEQAVANISTIKPEIDTSGVFNALNEMQRRVPQTAAQLGTALYDIFSSVDVSQQQALRLLEQFAQGATGAGTDAQTFGTAVMGVMNAYKLSVEDAGHVSDVFFNTVKGGVVTGAELAANLGLVTQSAKMAGADINELGGMIAGVTREGGPAAQNINNLNNLLLKMGTKEAAVGFKDLSINVANADGTMRPVMDVMGDLKTATAGMTEEARNLAIQKIFPDLQARAGATVLMSQLDFVRAAIEENINSAGSAEAAFTKMNATFNSQVKILSNTFTSLLVTVGAKILPVITPIITAFAKGLPDAFDQAGKALAPFGERVAEMGSIILPILEAIPDAWRTIGQVFENDWSPDETLGPFINMVGTTAIKVRDLIDVVVGLPEPVKAAGIAFAVTMVAAGPLAGILGALAAPIAALLSPLTLLALAVAGLAAAWTANLGGIQEKTQAFLDIVEPAFTELGAIIGTAVRGDIAGAFIDFQTLVSDVGTALGPLLAGWGAEFVAWVPGAMLALTTTLGEQVALIPWALIWERAITAATALATFLGTLVVDFSTWLSAQVALIKWDVIWGKAITVATALATYVTGLAVDFSTWLSAQAALIKWDVIWQSTKDVATALGTYVLGLTVDFATWLKAQVGAIPWADVWASATQAAGEFNAFIITQTVDFATWLGEQVVSIPWDTVWAKVTGLLEAMTTSFTTAASGIKWGDVITANAAMAQEMGISIGTKIADAVTGVNWDTVGQNVGKGLVDAFGIAFGMAVVSDAWARGFGTMIGRALPSIAKALLAFVTGFFTGLLTEAWNLAVATWVPGMPTISPKPGPFPGFTIDPPAAAPPAQGPILGPPEPPAPPGETTHPGLPVLPAPTTIPFTPPEQAAAPAAPAAAAPIDNSSRTSFVKTAWPYMLQAAGGNRRLAELMLGTAINENGRVGSGGDLMGNNFFGIKGKGPTGKSQMQSTWEEINGQRVPITDEFAVFDSPTEGMGGFMDFLKKNPRYAPALAEFERTGDADRLYTGIHAAGYATDSAWPGKIRNITDDQVAPLTSGLPSLPTEGPGLGQPVGSGDWGNLPDPGSNLAPGERPPTNQDPGDHRDVDPSFNPDWSFIPPRPALPAFAGQNQPIGNQWELGLPYAQAAAACGPAAVALFMQATGRTPNAQEVMRIAAKNGWTPGEGMGGVGAFMGTLGDLGVQAALLPATGAAAQASVQAGNLTAISTGGGAGLPLPYGHYFAAQGFDPETGKFDLGETGGPDPTRPGATTALKGGSRFMTAAEITALAGPINGVIQLLNQAVVASDATVASFTTMGATATIGGTQLAAIGTAMDPVVASMDTGVISVGAMTDAIIANAAEQGVGVESAANYSAGLTTQDAALRTVIESFAATTPAAATLLEQMNAGTISTDDAALAFAGLSTTTAIATGSLSAMGTDGAAAVDAMATGITTDADLMKMGLLTNIAEMQATGTTDLQGLQADGTVAVEGLQADATIAAQGLQTDGSLALGALQTDGTLAAQGLQNDATLAMQGLQADGTLATQTLQTDASAEFATVAENAGISFDATATAAEEGFDAAGSAADGVVEPLGDAVSGFEDVGTAAGDAVSPIEDFASAAASVKPINTGDTVKNLEAIRKAATSAATALEKLGEAGKHVSSGGKSGGDEEHGGSKSGGGKARGGSVLAGVGYIVGEQGPEFFIPGDSGTIIPNGGGSAVSLTAGSDQVLSLLGQIVDVIKQGSASIVQAVTSLARVAAPSTPRVPAPTVPAPVASPSRGPAAEPPDVISRPTPPTGPRERIVGVRPTPAPQPVTEQPIPGMRQVAAQAQAMAAGVTAAAQMMQTQTVGATIRMVNGVVVPSGVMQEDVVASAALMRDGVVGSAIRMKDGVVVASELMQTGVTGGIALMRDVAVGDVGDMNTRVSSQANIMHGNVVFSAGKMNRETVAEAGTMEDLVVKRAEAMKTNTSIEAAKMQFNVKVDVDTMRGDAEQATRGMRDDVTLHAGTLKTNMDLAMGGVKGALQLLTGPQPGPPNGGAIGSVVVGFGGISTAGKDVADKPMDPKKWVDALGKIEKAAKDAASAIKNIPSAPGARGDSVLSSADLMTSRGEGGVDHDKLAAAIVRALRDNPTEHPINFSLTLDRNTQDYEITEAQARSAT